MWSVKRGGSSPALRSASLALLWLAFFFGGPLSPLTAQSTTSAPRQPDTKPKSVTVSVEVLQALYLKIYGLENNSVLLEEQLQQSERTQRALSTLLDGSLTKQESLDRASKARAELDQKALESARAGQLAWAGGGFLVGAGLAVVAVLLFRR